MFCINCGTQLPEGTQFCHQCGRKIILQRKSCPKCLNQYDGSYVFCGNCGTLMQLDRSATQGAPCSLSMNRVAYSVGLSPSLVPQAVGTLTFDNEKLQFIPNNDYDKVRSAFSAATLSNSLSLRYDEIAAAEEGRRRSTPYLTITTKDGQALCFLKNSYQIQSALQIIRQHINP